ncbi:hypothetical protein [Eikenella sp. Marseille-P7795]|uniref:hypothetical protein n=1 Tax=Eikenella sp. Marseille-P7795 TaxID=2866577 RepID=UPI001CE475AF|nr:hypothetical protein [Eikenella sp. Marseille-P7795]
MTTYPNLLVDTCNRAYERFVRAFDGVSAEQANAFPAAGSAPQIKSMAWLAGTPPASWISRLPP